MTSKPQLAAEGAVRPDAADRSTPAVPADSFVINLCSSTTPMALSQPDVPELKRFRFFVSRRLEDRRERFRLHMGYFATLEEAEEWLGAVRDVYPGAWAGEAPGKRLRARATSQGAAAFLPPPAKFARADDNAAAGAAWQTPSALTIAAPPNTAGAIALPTAAVAESAAAAAPPAAAPAPVELSLIEAPRSAPAVTPPSAPVKEKPQSATTPAAAPAARAPGPVATAKKSPAPANARAARPAPLAPLSNVREVLAALDAPAVNKSAPQATQALTDTQVMRILEERRSQERAQAAPHDPVGNIPMLRPEDTGTRRALQEAVQANTAVSFAVQLQWSTQPIELEKVPPLAIFSAYTIYTVEGSREGRKWFGLRLGFFSDADAAKQVAHYVRSEFTSVAVLPVSSEERGRAAAADEKSEPAHFKETTRAAPADEITLLDEKSAEVSVRTPAEPMRGAAKLASGGARAGAAAARAAAMRSKKLRSKEHLPERKAPSSLEETLEILGADSLEIDNGRGEFINETGVRHLSVEVRKNSPFARLVARLTERVRKS